MPFTFVVAAQTWRQLRVDVMARMRGVAPFPELWARRTTVETTDGSIDVMSLPDLVQAKKTQRDKDWPMIRRLVDRNYFETAKRQRPANRLLAA